MYGYSPTDVNIDLSGIMTGVFDEIVASLLDLMLTVLPTVMIVVGAVIAIRLAVSVFNLILNSDTMINRDYNNECDDFLREARRNEQLERYGYFDGAEDAGPRFWDDDDFDDSDDFGVDDIDWNRY